MARLRLPVPPSVNHYVKHYCKDAPKDEPHQIGAYVTPRARQYKSDAGWKAKAAGVRMAERGIPVGLEIDLYQTENSHSLDADNILKVILDALNGIAWEDDKQVADIHIHKHEVKRGPRVEIEIFELERR